MDKTIGTIGFAVVATIIALYLMTKMNLVEVEA